MQRIPVTNDSAPSYIKAGDRLNTPALSGCSACEVWARPLTGGALAVALYNPGEAAATVALALPEKARARDLWALRDLGVVSKLSGIPLPAHGVHLVRLEPALGGAGLVLPL